MVETCVVSSVYLCSNHHHKFSGTFLFMDLLLTISYHVFNGLRFINNFFVLRFAIKFFNNYFIIKKKILN